jgi:hypothetical protein
MPSVAGVYLGFLGAGDLGLDRACLPDRHHHRPRQPPRWPRATGMGPVPIRAWGTVAYHEMLLAGFLIA